MREIKRSMCRRLQDTDNTVVSNLWWCLSVFLTQTRRRWVWKLISITMHVCVCVVFSHQYFPPGLVNIFKACHGGGRTTDKMKTRTFTATESMKKTETKLWINVWASRGAECIRNFRTHEYSSMCHSLMLKINKANIVQTDLNLWWTVISFIRPIFNVYDEVPLMAALRLHAEVDRFQILAYLQLTWTLSERD